MNAPDENELVAVAEIAATQDMIDDMYEPNDDAWF